MVTEASQVMCRSGRSGMWPTDQVCRIHSYHLKRDLAMYVNMLKSETMTYGSKAASGSIRRITCHNSMNTPTAMIDWMKIPPLVVVFKPITPFLVFWKRG